MSPLSSYHLGIANWRATLLSLCGLEMTSNSQTFLERSNRGQLNPNGPSVQIMGMAVLSCELLLHCKLVEGKGASLGAATVPKDNHTAVSRSR